MAVLRNNHCACTAEGGAGLAISALLLSRRKLALSVETLVDCKVEEAIDLNFQSWSRRRRMY